MNQSLKILFLILLVVSNTTIHAQSSDVKWQTCFDLPGTERIHYILPFERGSILLESYASEHYGDVLIRKVTHDGALISEHTYGGSYGDGAIKMYQVDNGDYILIGGTSSIDGDITYNPYPDTWSYWIVRIDSLGNKLWDKVLGSYRLNTIMDGLITSDNGIAMFGWIEGGGGDVSEFYGGRDMWLIKTDIDGNKLWDYTIGTSTIDYGYCIIETKDKGFLLGGSSLVEGGYGGNIECQPHGWKPEAILFKLDSAGNYQWQRCYGGSEIETIHTVVELNDGFILGCNGSSDDGDMAGSGYHLGYHQPDVRTQDIWIVKVDFSGNIIWQKCYGGTEGEGIHSIYPKVNGNFLIVGSTNSFDGDVVGNYSIDKYSDDIWIFEIDSVGNLLWQDCLGGPNREGRLLASYAKSDYEFVIAASLEGQSLGDIKCDENHIYIYGTWLFEYADTTLSVIKDKYNISFNLYPNPVESYMVIESATLRGGSISVYDIYGNLKHNQIVTSDKTLLDARGYTNGMYLLKYTDKSGNSVTKKFIVSHS